MRPECDRTRLIAELASLLRECELPCEARTAGLILIGFLARRMPGEDPSDAGVAEVRAACEALMLARADVEPVSGSESLAACCSESAPVAKKPFAA